MVECFLRADRYCENKIDTFVLKSLQPVRNFKCEYV